MKPSTYLYLFILFLLLFGVVKAAFAGGADESLDPLNGCFAKPDASAGDHKIEADFINHRGQYSIIVDRYMSITQCWNRKANCIGVQVECYRGGKVVYEGKVKFWNGQ